MASALVGFQKTINSAFQKFGFYTAERSLAPPAQTSETDNVFASILSPFETYVVSVQSLLIWERPYLSAAAFLTVNCLFCETMTESESSVTNEATVILHNLLTWEQPLFSAVALVALNCIFWLIVSWNRKFYSVLSLGYMIVFLYRTWVNQIWPEIRVPPLEGEDTEGWTPVHPQVLSVPELSRYLNDLWNKVHLWWKGVWKLRETNHGLFCIFLCAVFFATALLGHWIPGVLIIYSLVLIVSLGPGVVLHLIPSSLYDQIEGLFTDNEATNAEGRIVRSHAGSDTDSELEEFLPEPSDEVMRQLSLRQESLDPSGKEDDKEASDSSKISETIGVRELGIEDFARETEEAALCQGIGTFPSVEEEDESDIEDDIPGELDGSIESKNGIHFVSTHYKEESSESENEAAFTEGLCFSNVVESVDSSEKEMVTSTPSEKKKDVGKDSEVKDSSNIESSSIAEKPSPPSDIDEELMDFEILEDSDVTS